MADEARVIVGTAVTVGGAIAALAGWAIKSVIAKDVAPVMIELKAEARALTKEFATFREDKAEERRETAMILRDMQKLLQEHEITLSQHTLRLEKLENPPPVIAVRKRGRAA